MTIMPEIRIKNCGPDHSEDENKKFVIEEDPLTLVPPDGGWGWMIVLGSFVIMNLSSTLPPSFSLLFSPLFAEHKISSTTAAWIYNGNQFMWNITALFGGPLCARFGWRRVAFCGGVLMSTSTIMCGFVPRPEYLFIFYSFLTGIGQGLSSTITFFIVPHYFVKKKGLAIGITVCGTSTGQFVGPLLIQNLLDHYGFKGANLILGAVLSNTCLASMLFQPVEWHSKKVQQIKTEKEIKLLIDCTTMISNPIAKSEFLEKGNRLSVVSSLNEGSEYFQRSCLTKSHSLSSLDGLNSNYIENNHNPGYTIKDLETETQLRNQDKRSTNLLIDILRAISTNLTLLKWHRVQIITISFALIITSYFNFFMIAPRALMKEGFSLQCISWSLAVAGICNMAARLVITTLTDLLPISTKYYFMAGALGVSTSIFIFKYLSNITYIMITMGIFGFSVGTCGCLISLTVLEFLGIHYLPQVIGLSGLTISSLFITLGPLLGMVIDVSGSFTLSFRLLSIFSLCSAGLWLFMPWAIFYDKKKEEKASDPERKSIKREIEGRKEFFVPEAKDFML